MNKRVFFIDHRSIHHAETSGYSHLSKGNKLRIIRFIPYRLSRYLSSKFDQKIGFYDSNSIYKEINALIRASYLIVGRQTVVFHFLNGERDLRIIPFFRKYFKSIRISGTYHKPKEYYSKNQLNYLSNNLDLVITVGSSQVEFFENYGLKTIYIPHGVDINFFNPKKRKVKLGEFLFVGQHLRDFETLNKLSESMEKFNKDYIIRCVVREEYTKFISKRANIRIYNGVSDEKLLDFYNKSVALVLPLLEVTACNSVLEALASGLPIISSNLESNQTYLRNTKNILLSNDDIEKWIDSMDLFNSDMSYNLHVSNDNYRCSKSYSWELIRGKFYQEIENSFFS